MDHDIEYSFHLRFCNYCNYECNYKHSSINYQRKEKNNLEFLITNTFRIKEKYV